MKRKHILMAPLSGGGGGGSSFPFASTFLANNITRAQFDPNRAATNVVLSGGNLTVSVTEATSNYYDARSDVGLVGGKVYYEFTLESLGTSAEDPELLGGFTDASYVPGVNLLGSDAHSLGIAVIPGLNRYQIGFNFVNTTFATGTPTVGQVIGVAIDIGNAAVWARLGAGNWNNSGTANPATNVGGISLSSWLNTGNPVEIYPAAQLQPFGSAAQMSLTFNFGATAFANTPPAGFN